MSVKVSSWVWHGEETAELAGNEMILLLALADVAADDGQCVYLTEDDDLTYAGLAKKARVDRRTVIRLVAKLRERGLLQQTKGTRNQPNVFAIAVPWRRGDNLSPVDSVTTGTFEVTSEAEKGDKPRTPSSLIRTDVRHVSPSEIELISGVSFEDFWVVWPRKVGKPDAARAWAKAVKNIDGGRIVAAAVAYRDNPGIPEKQFIPHPATWLNRHGWDDELPAGSAAPMQRAREVLDLGRQMAAERAAS